MKKVFEYVMVAMMVAVVATGCSKKDDDNGDGNEPNNESGKAGALTIIGLPSGPAYDVDVFAGDTKLDTDLDRMFALTGMLAHGGVPAKGGNAFTLYQGMASTTRWTGGGTNLKIMLSESTPAADYVNPKIATKVTITNGTGEVDFSAFTPFGNNSGNGDGRLSPPAWLTGEWRQEDGDISEDMKITANNVVVSNGNLDFSWQLDKGYMANFEEKLNGDVYTLSYNGVNVANVHVEYAFKKLSVSGRIERTVTMPPLGSVTWMYNKK